MKGLPVESPQQHLDSHYGDVGFTLVDDDESEGPGMTPAEANRFLRGLRPVTRVVQTLGSLAKKAKPKA